MMAEFGNDEAHLDLFQDVLNPMSSSMDDVIDVSKTVNITVDSNANKRSSNNFVKASVVGNNIDNDALEEEEDVAGDLIEEAGDKDLEDSVVILNNRENLKKNNEAVNSTTTTGTVTKNCDIRDDRIDVDRQAETNDDEVNDCDRNNIVNGNTDVELNYVDTTTCDKGRRGIRFPKDTFISGYFEPPDPWKNAPSWTTDELVLAYRKSCELHGTKPINKLVQQLQAFLSGKQEELLSLKGEKLDQKQVESLEEILRRVQFKLLDLEASHLDDECAVALFDMIEYYESACQLNIACNKNIQARGWQACSRLVRRTPNLTYLDLRSCDLNDRNIPIFGRALKLGCHLTILHMECINLSGRPLVILVAALKTNETLQELFLAENKLMPTDGVQLGNLLRFNHKLALLDLRNNHLQDVGTSHIADGLMEQVKGSGLRTLVLWNNSMNYQAMPALGRALAVNENLETLNIGHNSLTNEGVHLMKDGLLKTNSLLRLGLQGTKITDEGAVALAEYIADSIILLRIDLRDNEIKTGGLMALSHAMRVNTSVTRIDLDKEPKKESSMKDYAEQQTHLLRDIFTFQQRNIQAAVKREEQEKAEQEERAKAALAAALAEIEKEQIAETVTVNESSQPFSLFENENVEVQEDIENEKNKKDAENAKAKEVEEKLKEGQHVDSDIDQLDSSPTKEDGKNRHRPSVLFPYIGLPPQASLDSPLPTSDESPLVPVLSEPVSAPQPSSQPCPNSQKGFLTLNMSSAPGEMILSPQYFPKQIARKIFSVSRVSEDPSCSPLSSSPTPPNTLSTVYDPLNVSPVLLIPQPTSTSEMSHQPCTLGLAQHSKTTSQTSVSPCSTLFENLAEETVRHMVSPIIDIDVKSLLSQNYDSINIENHPVSNSSDFLDTSVNISNISQTFIHKNRHVSDDVFESCDNQESSEDQSGSISITVSNIKEDFNETNSGSSPSDNLVVITFEKENKNRTDLILGDNDPVINSDVTPGVKNIITVPEIKTNESSCDSHCKKNISGLGGKGETTEGVYESVFYKNIIVDECYDHSSNDCLLHNEDDIESALKQSDFEISAAINIDKKAVDDTWYDEDALNVKQFLQKKQDHAMDVHLENVQSETIERYHPLADLHVSQEIVSTCMNNSNSNPLHFFEDDKELSSIELNKNSSTFESLDNEEHPSSLCVDLICSVDLKNNMQKNDTDFSLKASEVSLKKNCADDHTVSKTLSSDKVSTVNVNTILDEGSRLSVENNTTDNSKETSDFFTTLSMNGLSQELTHAVTPLEGSTVPSGNDQDNLDLRPHDEFEKELDALLAIVQSDLPWPLKDS